MSDWRLQDAHNEMRFRDRNERMRIDMAGVTFMDSSGLTALLEADRRCRELGATLEVVASRFIARLLALTGNPVPHLGPSEHGRPTSAIDRLAHHPGLHPRIPSA